jgi:sulfur-oxidizing protein SoxZ
VVTVSAGPAISEDPLIGFRLKDAKHGDKLKVFWSDNMGESATLEGTVDLS